MGPRPSDGWIKIGVGGGVLLIKHETFQSLINLFFPKIFGERGGEGGGVKKFPPIPFFSNFRINVP
jgi:hypothetical protein